MAVPEETLPGIRKAVREEQHPYSRGGIALSHVAEEVERPCERYEFAEVGSGDFVHGLRGGRIYQGGEHD